MLDIARLLDNALANNRMGLRKAAKQTLARAPLNTTVRELLASEAGEAIRELTISDLEEALIAASGATLPSPTKTGIGTGIGKTGIGTGTGSAAAAGPAATSADSQSREIAEAIERAYAGFATGGDRVDSLRDQVQANNRTVSAYREEYQLGKRSQLDLLDGENSRFNSEFQYQSASAIYYFSAYQLLAHMGRLLTTLGVSAPAEALTGHVEQSKQSLFHIDIEPLRQ